MIACSPNLCHCLGAAIPCSIGRTPTKQVAHEHFPLSAKSEWIFGIRKRALHGLLLLVFKAAAGAHYQGHEIVNEALLEVTKRMSDVSAAKRGDGDWHESIRHNLFGSLSTIYSCLPLQRRRYRLGDCPYKSRPVSLPTG